MSGSAPFGVSSPGDDSDCQHGRPPSPPPSGGGSGGWPSGGSWQPPQGGVPTCYRHPDRETHLACQRCSRPICPDCMVGAPVGFQCPECVRTGMQETRRHRTAMGAARQTNAYLTYVLIAANVIMFGLAHLLPDRDLVNRLFLLPDALNGVGYSDASTVVTDDAWWQPLTSAFLHVDPIHLLMNMVALWFFGSFLELTLGWARFLGLYLVSALAGSTAVMLASDPYVPVLGASGAVFGLFGAAFLLILKARGDVSQLVVLLVLNLVIGFTADGIAWQAHLGGLAAGAVVGVTYAYAPRSSRTLLAVGVQLALVVAMVAAVIARTSQLAA